MQKVLIGVIGSIMPKLIEKFLTPAAIEKYSDKLWDVCKKGIAHIEDDKIKDVLLAAVEALDEAIGE